MATFSLPDFKNDSWGPPVDAEIPFSDLPFTPFSKRDVVNYVADWFGAGPIGSSYFPPRGRGAGGPGASDGRKKVGQEDAVLVGFGEDIVEEEGFKMNMKMKNYEKDAKTRKDSGKQAEKMTTAHQKLASKAAKRIEKAAVRHMSKAKRQVRDRRRKNRTENLRPVVPSCKKQDTWISVGDIYLKNIQNEQADVPRNTKTLFMAGDLHSVLSMFDNCVWDNPKPLNTTLRPYNPNNPALVRCPVYHFEWTSASQDPYMLDLASKRAGNIYACDTIVAMIMNVLRSKYSFDIIINKIGDCIFLDSRPRANEQWHVDENSPHRPTTTKGINKWQQLAEEATTINYTFREQMVSHQLNTIRKSEKPHPFTKFCPKDKSIASVAFLYRTIDVDEKTKLVIRCEVHGYNPNKPSENQLIYALNQYDSSLSRTTNWNTIEFARKAEAVLSEELNNNSYKCARWCTHAELAGIEKIKLGYIRRSKTSDDTLHDIAKVETRTVRELSRPLSLNPKSQWGMFNTFMRNFSELPNGRYIAIREPVKHMVRVFSIPEDAFSKENLEEGIASFDKLRQIIGVVGNTTNTKRE